MKCHVCNSSNRAGQQFCSKCGTNFGKLARNSSRKFYVNAAVTIIVLSVITIGINDLGKDLNAAENDKLRNQIEIQKDCITDFEAEWTKLKKEETVLSSKTVEKSDRSEDNKPYLLSKSTLSAERLDKFLAGSNLKGLGASFKAAEMEYGVNATFLTAVAIHESNWGKNTISKQKNNILSICAYDWSPVSSAKNYKTKTECVLRGAELLKRDYLTKGGKYYNGATLEGVNKSYATDKGWAGKVRYFIRQIEKAVKV
jgi:beta-N-acetylglucosaminidase